MDPSQRVISDRSASLPELDEAWASALDSGLGRLFDSAPPAPLATDSPFLVGGATSLEGAIDALGSQTQRVIAMESALVAAWTRGNDLAGRNRELLAQRAEDSAVINRARREREDALGEAAHLRRDIAAYDAVFRALGMSSLRYEGLPKVIPAVAALAPRVIAHLPTTLRRQDTPPPAQEPTAPSATTPSVAVSAPSGAAPLARTGPQPGYAPVLRPPGHGLSSQDEAEVALLLQRVSFPLGWEFVFHRVWAHELGRDGDLDAHVTGAPVHPVRSVPAPPISQGVHPLSRASRQRRELHFSVDWTWRSPRTSFGASRPFLSRRSCDSGRVATDRASDAAQPVLRLDPRPTLQRRGKPRHLLRRSSSRTPTRS
jgi:hypothetical protein